MIIFVEENSLRVIIRRYARVASIHTFDLFYDSFSLKHHYYALQDLEGNLEMRMNERLRKEGFSKVAWGDHLTDPPMNGWADIYFFGDINTKNCSDKIEGASHYPKNRTYIVTSDPIIKKIAPKKGVHTISEQDIESTVQRHKEVQKKFGDRQVDLSYCVTCLARNTLPAQKYSALCVQLPNLIQKKGVLVNISERTCMGFCGRGPIEIEPKIGPARVYNTSSQRFNEELERQDRSSGIYYVAENPLEIILKESTLPLLTNPVTRERG